MPRQNTGTPPINRTPPIMEDLKLLESQAPRGGRGDPLSDLERMAMLHGLDCGLTPARIGARWKMSPWTVRAFRKALYENPFLVLRLKTIQRTGNGVFQCRLCGEPRGKLAAAQRHVLAHFFAHEVAQNIDLRDMPRFYSSLTRPYPAWPQPRM